MSTNDAPFSINIAGDVETDRYIGDFRTKVRLSHRDHLERDRIRRELLGADPVNASPRAASIAEIVSQLAVRITKAPPWWVDSDNGLSLSEDSVLAAVYDAAIKVERDAFEEIKKKAEQAKKELKEISDVVKTEETK